MATPKTSIRPLFPSGWEHEPSGLCCQNIPLRRECTRGKGSMWNRIGASTIGHWGLQALRKLALVFERSRDPKNAGTPVHLRTPSIENPFYVCPYIKARTWTKLARNFAQLQLQVYIWYSCWTTSEWWASDKETLLAFKCHIRQKINDWL
jgi:hypothetical protein